MKTENSFYRLRSLTSEAGDIQAKFKLNKEAALFSGHFPGNPVLPAACMLELLKDILEKAVERKMILKEAHQLKFLSQVVPSDDQELVFDIKITTGNKGDLNAVGNLLEKGKLCFKFMTDWSFL